jgi:hypothetical protein
MKHAIGITPAVDITSRQPVGEQEDNEDHGHKQMPKAKRELVS